MDSKFNLPSRHIKLFAIALSAMVALTLIVHVMADYTRFGIAFVRSGNFVNIEQSISANSLTFSAHSANGHNTFFVTIPQGDLSEFLNFALSSKISDGEVYLIISQRGISRQITLHNNELNTLFLSSFDIDTSSFSYGLFEIRLNFVESIEVFVNIEWLLWDRP